jgi:hydrogenobyrinic acid a,c-diamide synthase (glutamine-hydrolysing) (EC 6.3.5.9)/cobyrinate a,c-diamide synthase (EC 6.3.5.-)
MPAPKACVIAGTHSGCGKTSVTLGLMTAFARRGLRVAPFKAGPDFIDPGLHARAAGRHSHNLDSWMLPPKAVRGLFARHAGEADLALVEGVMGLFDGLSPTENTGSTAELAALLDLPVILVADARSLARSAAALVQGYVRFDPALRFAGVILDRVGSTSHADTLRKALEAHLPGPPLLGCLPRDDSLALPARHLGLVTAEDAAGLDELLGRLADACERHLDLDALLAALPAVAPAAPDDPPPPGTRARIGLARTGPSVSSTRRTSACCATPGPRSRPSRRWRTSICPRTWTGSTCPAATPNWRPSTWPRTPPCARRSWPSPAPGGRSTPNAAGCSTSWTGSAWRAGPSPCAAPSPSGPN